MEDKIINYISETPENTNPAVLHILLGDLKGPTIDSADVVKIVKDEFAGGVGYTETQNYSVTWNGIPPIKLVTQQADVIKLVTQLLMFLNFKR